MTPATVTTLPDGLTARELAVLQLIAQGRTNRAIERELSISEHTAANHVRSILTKTGSANRAEASSYAHRHRLAVPSRAR
jgi:DNA-binding NarL/FixJ family response regulator